MLSLYWRRFNTAGAVWGLGSGLAVSIALIALNPSVMDPNGKALILAEPIFPLKNPGIVSIPLGFLAAWVATMLSGDRTSEEKFAELVVRAHTGLGAEKATT